MKLSPDLKEFIELLNSKKVDYIIIGAHALAWHGLPRYTKDIDILIRAEADNAEAVLSVLKSFGFGQLELQIKDFTKPGQVIQLGMEPNRIDLLTSISGVDWESCWSSKVQGDMGGTPVFFLGIETYLKNKAASGRPQDIADAERLKKIQEE